MLQYEENGENEKTAIEIRIAAEDSAFVAGVIKPGKVTLCTCPDCHDVLSALSNGNIRRFRCHTERAFYADTLLAPKPNGGRKSSVRRFCRTSNLAKTVCGSSRKTRTATNRNKKKRAQHIL